MADILSALIKVKSYRISQQIREQKFLLNLQFSNPQLFIIFFRANWTYKFYFLIISLLYLSTLQLVAFG